LKNSPFNTVGLCGDDVQALEDSYNALKSKFNIGLPDSNAHINRFELFNNESEASVIGTYLIDSPSVDCYLNFVKIHYNYSIGRSQVNNYGCQAWAFVNLKHDFGRVIIRKETFTDTLLNLIQHTELKFKDDKVFNDNFYAAANDTNKAIAGMTIDFRNVIKQGMYPSFVIEINGNALVIRNNQPVDVDQTVKLLGLANKIAITNS